MKTKKLNARASAYANSVEPEDERSNDAVWMAARRGYIAGWKARNEKGRKCEDGGWHVSAIFVDDIIESKTQSLIPKQKTAIKCEREDEFEFAKIWLKMDIITPFKGWYRVPCLEIGTDTCGCVGSESNAAKSFELISFRKWLFDNRIETKWIEFFKEKEKESKSLKPKPIAVKCDTEGQYKFVWRKRIGLNLENYGFNSLDDDGKPYNCISEGGVQNSEWHAKNGFNVINFTTYITDNHLESEWNAFRSLKPEDLEDGEIYASCIESREYAMLFRFKYVINTGIKNGYCKYYSFVRIMSDDSGFSLDGSLLAISGDRICRPATLPEKLKLIEQELRHGYDHSKK